MEGGGFGEGGNILDPAAQEFHPSSHLAIVHPQIYYPYPPPPPPLPTLPPPSPTPSMGFYQSLPQPPAYVSQPLPDGSVTRALLLSSVPSHVMEGEVRMELEAFGGVRLMEMGRLAGEGVVTVHFYDLRSAQAALAAIREQHVRQQSRLGQQYGVAGLGVSGGGVVGNWGPWELLGELRSSGVQMGCGLVAGHAVWAQFAPEAAGIDGPNNGSLVVFNLDANVSSSGLREIFEAFGAVKELRETPSKPQHRFVEFYDIRDAAHALSQLNGKEIYGKRLLIEFSRPGGQGRRKGSNYQSSPLPPRLHQLPRSLSSSSNKSSSSSHGKGGDPPQSSPSSMGVRGGKSGGVGDCTSSSKRSANADNHGNGARNKINCNYQSLPLSESSSAKQQPSRHRSWKNHTKKAAADARFFFREDAMVASSSSAACRDSRTTVMIKNIPNKYSQKLLLNMLDNHCIHCNEQIDANEGEGEPISSYDFVYLPIDFNNKCNVGYGFVNMTSSQATWRLYKAFHMQPWEVFNSRKICQVTYARLQGLEALKEHFKNSKLCCDTDEYMPVMFSPPRDGKTLTDPVPIGGRGSTHITVTKMMSLVCLPDAAADPSDGGGSTTTTTSTPAPSDEAECCDYDEDEDDDDNYRVDGDGGGDDVTQRQLS